MSDVVIPERLPLLIRLLGGKWRDGRRSYRMRWGELGFGRRGSAIDLINFGDESGWSLHLHAFWLDTFIKLPLRRRAVSCPDHSPMKSWGFSCDPQMGLHLHRGCRTKIVTMPWRYWVQTSHDVRRQDGSWVPFVGSWEHGEEPDGRHVETYPYRYVFLRTGEVQEREASIYVERRCRKLKWLRWLPFKRTSYAISVEFNDEVGERSGSWKGGVTGCSYSLRPDETPRECLLRMERERRFT